jgi:hypothetical protein
VSRRIRKISPPSGVRTPDSRACSESLYRLSYPGFQMHQKGLKLNGIRQLLVYGHVSATCMILGESIHTRKKNIEAMLVASKEVYK